jgi:ribosome biogenesis GTPase
VFRKDGLIPLPGDKVLFTVIKEDEDTGFIESIEPRQSQLLRPAVANVDQLAIIIATKSPEPDFVLLDKLLVTAKRENIEPFICINKIDLDTEGNYVKIVESSSPISSYSSIALILLVGFSSVPLSSAKSPLGSLNTRYKSSDISVAV